MGYGNRRTNTAEYLGNNPECRNCGARYYWRGECLTCRDLPIRWCFACGRTSQTQKAECLHCDARFGPMVFGFDRLPAAVAICTAWPKDANPFASALRRRVDREMRKSGAAFQISGLRSCYVCGQSFQLGAKRAEYRDRIVPALEYVDGDWVRTPHYITDKMQKAHSTCPEMPEETALRQSYREAMEQSRDEQGRLPRDWYSVNRVVKPAVSLGHDDYGYAA